MPKSKRSRVVSLTETDKKGRELKDDLVNSVRAAVDKYNHIYVLEFFNMRTNAFKDLRYHFADSRFFLGKNKVMSIALGRTEAEEYRTGLHQLCDYLTGDSTLFFTNRPEQEILDYFKQYQVQDYARSGFKATETYVIPQGPIPFAHSMLEEFRRLKLPVDINNGILTMSRDYKVCTEGKILTPEQCRILKYWNHPMATFHLVPIVHWTNDKVVVYEEKKKE